MFKGLHNALHKAHKVKPLAANKHPALAKVQTAEQLLNTSKRQEHLRHIKSLLNLPPKLYDGLYHKIIQSFSEFVQTLPETQYGIFNSEGGFLDHGIERAARALSLCLAYFFPQEKTLQAVSSQEALWIYAVFTAALLLDVGKIAVKYQVNICNHDGSALKVWLPYSGSLLKQGKFYRYSWLKQNRDNLRRLVTALVARQILDDADAESDSSSSSSGGGFNWIASSPDVLEAWLIILSGDQRAISPFMTVIPLADAQTIENFLVNNANNQPPTKQEQLSQILNPNLPTEDNNAYNLAMGKEFLEWLRTGLADGSIPINTNNADVHRVEEGVLLDPNIFKRFIDANPQYAVAGSVDQQFRQFLELYVTSPGQLGLRYSQIRGLSTLKMEQYLLIANICLLYPLGQAPAVNPNIIRTPSTQPAALPNTAPTPIEAPHAQLLYR